MLLPYMEQASLADNIDWGLPITDPFHDVVRQTHVSAYICPSDTSPRLITVTDSGDHVAGIDATAIPVPITQASVTSYVGCLGGGDPSSPPPNGRHEDIPFNGMFHRNTSIRDRDVIDGLSNTIGLGERMSRRIETSWVGVVPGQELIYSSQARGLYDPNRLSFRARSAVIAVLAHVRSGPPNSPTGGPGGFAGPHPAGVNFLNMDGACRVITDHIDIRIFRSLAQRNDGIPIPDVF